MVAIPNKIALNGRKTFAFRFSRATFKQPERAKRRKIRHNTHLSVAFWYVKKRPVLSLRFKKICLLALDNAIIEGSIREPHIAKLARPVRPNRNCDTHNNKHDADSRNRQHHANPMPFRVVHKIVHQFMHCA